MPAGYKSISTLTSGQKKSLKQLLGSLGGQPTNIMESPLFQQGQGYLQNLLQGGPQATSAFEAPYLREFQQRTIPALAERFAGLGSGALSSSAFQQALGSAGAGLQEQLAALRSGLQMQALPQALGFAQQPIANRLGFTQLGLGTQAQGYVPQQLPFWQSALLGLAPGLGQLGGMFGLGGLLGGLGRTTR
jgi:hypothetical protein